MSLPAVFGILAAIAIGTGGCADAPTICRPGFVQAQDGHCYPPIGVPGPPSVTQVLEGGPPCVPLKPGTEIDLFAGCLDGACAGDTFAAIDDVLGRGADCRLNSAETLWTCDWLGIEAAFDRQDGDTLLPNPGAETDFIRTIPGYTGASSDGLGMDVAARCFLDVLGPPTSAEFVDVTGDLEMQQLLWVPYGIEIEDEESLPYGESFPDGIVDEITLTGPE